MARNITDLRFTAYSPSGHMASVWRIWATKSGDIYLATRHFAWLEKFSFHASGICRRAFTKEQGPAPGNTDRLSYRWRRAEIPPSGNGGATRLAWIAAPTNCLSYCPGFNPQGHSCVSPAPPGQATYFEVCLTHESQNEVERAFRTGGGRGLLLYRQLPTGPALFVDWYHFAWEQQDFKLSGQGVIGEIQFSQEDPQHTGRRVRMVLSKAPADGEAVLITDLGGFPAVC